MDAIRKGFFKEEGLQVTFVNTNGADKTMAALLSKDAQIGLMGPEASMYVYLNGQQDYALNFAQLTQKDGSFLVGRENIDNFDISQNVKFSTYAVPMIIGEIRRHLRDNNPIRVSRSIRDLAYKSLQIKEKIVRETGREPTIEEVAKYLRVSEQNPF